MREFILHSSYVYILSFLVCLVLMLLADFLLGNKAEYLNAWDILLSHFNLRKRQPTCKAVNNFGLWGATLMVVLSNVLLGGLLILFLRLIFLKY